MKIGLSSIVSVLVLCMIVSVIGCTGVSVVGYPLDDGQYLVQRTISDPHAFAPTTQRSWLEVCTRRVETVQHGQANASEIEHFEHCQRDGSVQFTTTNGYLDGLGSAALYSGAIVGGAALIGTGIAQSGSTTTLQSNQAGAAATQSQGQGQAQSQYGIGNGRH